MSSKGGIMKVWRLITGVITIIIFVGIGTYGCTAYKAARDERSMGTIMDDTTLSGKIKYQLLKDDTVKGLDISVYVYYGKVYLVGVVESNNQKSQAINIAKSIEGVKSVTTYILNKNQTTIGKTVDDTAITAKVKAKMIEDKQMKSTQIEVKTILGQVVLLGVVSSKSDISKAIGYAKSVENVRKVKSFVIVK